MSETIKFSRTLKQIELEDGSTIELPKFCNKRISFYQFNKETKVVEIVCSKCKKAYPVLKIEKDDDGKSGWLDIHKENKYHFMSEVSGYAAECVECKSADTKQSKKRAKIVGNKDDKLSYTVFLTSENKKYLQLYRIIYEEEITDIINSLIDELKIKKPIEIKTK